MNEIYRINSADPYDVGGLELWLERMARRGLCLKKFRPLFSTFVKGEPQELRFRAEPFRRKPDENIPPAMLELYQDFGWTYCGEVSEPPLLLFSTDDPQAPEPHTDPELLGELWEGLYRSARRQALFQLFLTLLATVSALLLTFGEGTPVLALTATSAPVLLAGIFLLLAICPQTWSDVRHLALLAEQARNGEPVGRGRGLKSRWKQRAVTGIGSLMLTGLVLSHIILPLTGGEMQPLESLTRFVPLTPAQVEGAEFLPDEDRAQVPGLREDGEVHALDYGNFCRNQHYLLCWDEWDVIQTGDIASEQWVRMEIQWYDPLISPTAVPLARELLEQAMRQDRDIWWTDNREAEWTVDYRSGQGADFLAVARRSDGGAQIAAVAAKGRAAVVRYTGSGDLLGCLDGIAAMVKGG